MDLSASDIRIIVIVFDVCLLFVCVCRKTTYYFTGAAVHAILTILWMRIITSVNRNKTLVASLWVFMNSIFILFWAAGGCTCPTRSARKRTPQRPAGHPERRPAGLDGTQGQAEMLLQLCLCTVLLRHVLGDVDFNLLDGFRYDKATVKMGESCKASSRSVWRETQHRRSVAIKKYPCSYYWVWKAM